MTKEQYLGINANELRALAKSRGVKKTSAMKKSELVEKMLELDRLEAASGMPEAAADGSEEKRARPENSQAERSQSERSQGEKVQSEKAQAGRSQSGQSQAERSRPERVQSEKARIERARPERIQSERSQNERPRSDRSQTDRIQTDRTQTDRTQTDRTQTDRSQTEYVLRKQAETRETASEELAPVRDVQEARAPQRQERQERQDQNQPGQNQPGQNQSGQNQPGQYQSKEDRHFRENGGRRATGESAERSPSQDYAVRSNVSAQPSGNEEESSSGSTYVPGRIPGDTGKQAHGILEVMQDGFGFLRSENFLPGEEDVYVSPSQIRRFNLKTGDMITGNKRDKAQGEKYGALLYVSKVNGRPADEARNRCVFEHMTPVFPDERIRLERPDGSRATRIVDLISPIGKGQRGMIVSPPKAGKTTLLKDIAKSILSGNPESNLIILLIDERPEEVTDMMESVRGKNVDIIYSTFDELPEHHRRVSEMVIERAKRLVEFHEDVIILLDSITRLTRAYNVLVPQSGRTLSGGLDPTALYMPKRFFGAARNMREGGSLTILATALVDTGSKMDDVVYEEFKGTGNMELILDRKLQERRIFPAIDIVKSGTRREDLLLTERERKAMDILHRRMNGIKADEAVEQIINAFAYYPTNEQVVSAILQKWQPVEKQ